MLFTRFVQDKIIDFIRTTNSEFKVKVKGMMNARGAFIRVTDSVNFIDYNLCDYID